MGSLPPSSSPTSRKRCAAASCALFAGDRAVAAHEADLAARDDPRHRLVTEVQMLEQARGQPARGARLADPLGAKRGLRRVLQNHGVALHQCRHDGIHGGQIRIVPGGDDERNAERHLAINRVKPGLSPPSTSASAGSATAIM